jgi:Zn-dependent peptidase ImmA (M78 family)
MDRRITLKYLNILGMSVKVIKKKNLIQEQDAEGLYNPVTNEISIDSSLEKDAFIATLLHEIGHAIIRRGGVYQSQIAPGVEEILVEQFATVIVENFNLTRKRK